MSALLLSLCALTAAPAGAQSQPVVEIIPISAEKRSRLPQQRIGVGDCYAVAGSQREELAVIQVLVRGPLERSAEHLAKEKAGELGANCLYPLNAFGADNASYPVRRNYRALRVTVQSGAYRAPASPETIASAGSASAAGALPSLSDFPKLKVPVIIRPAESHNGHLGWVFGGGVLSHEVIVDFSKSEEAIRKDLLKDIEEYFSDAEYRRMLKAAEAGERSRIELPR